MVHIRQDPAQIGEVMHYLGAFSAREYAPLMINIDPKFAPNEIDVWGCRFQD
jgi:hypothetical protein